MATQLKHASETLSKAYERSRDVFEDVTDQAQHLYEDAREWVPEHRGTVALLSSTAVGLCLIGYVAGRKSRRGPSAQPYRALGETASAFPRQISDDLAPVFKFLKLWMLYRVATRD